MPPSWRYRWFVAFTRRGQPLPLPFSPSSGVVDPSSVGVSSPSQFSHGMQGSSVSVASSVGASEVVCPSSGVVSHSWSLPPPLLPSSSQASSSSSSSGVPHNGSSALAAQYAPAGLIPAFSRSQVLSLPFFDGPSQ